MIYFPNESFRTNEKRSAYLEIATESCNRSEILYILNSFIFSKQAPAV